MTGWVAGGTRGKSQHRSLSSLFAGGPCEQFYNEQDTTHFIQRPCYQRGSPCQDPAGNQTTRRPDDRKETQTAVVWSCHPFIRSGQNHFARHSKREKKTRRTKEEMAKQHQEMYRPGVRKVLEGSGEEGKMETTGCKIICGAPKTLAVEGLMMMMMKTMDRDVPSLMLSIQHFLCRLRRRLPAKVP